MAGSLMTIPIGLVRRLISALSRISAAWSPHRSNPAVVAVPTTSRTARQKPAAGSWRDREKLQKVADLHRDGTAECTERPSPQHSAAKVGRDTSAPVLLQVHGAGRKVEQLLTHG
jgi:hypothetical protein